MQIRKKDFTSLGGRSSEREAFSRSLRRSEKESHQSEASTDFGFAIAKSSKLSKTLGVGIKEGGIGSGGEGARKKKEEKKSKNTWVILSFYWEEGTQV